MQKKLAIIGANSAIAMLISKAKSLGYETHVFAWECGDPGEKLADYFYPISIDKKEEIASKCKEIGVEGVCSITSDFAAPTVNYVSRKLGLPSNPEVTEDIARNKYKMRSAFKKAGIYTPHFALVDLNYTDAELKGLKYPVIVKPTDRWSSKGVTRVDRREDLDNALKCAISESFNNQAIVEEFMDGQEYSAECICYQGKKIILAITQKETTGYPHYIETEHFQPACLTEQEYAKVVDTVLKALDALRIENSAAHAEFKILPSGEIGIIEVGARMGGDCIGTDLVQISTGMDYIRMVIDVACGNVPSLEVVSKPSKVRVKFIMNGEDLLEMEKFKSFAPDMFVRVAEIDNDFERKVVDSNTRHGYYIVKES